MNMTLLDLINILDEVALNQPQVKQSVGGDIYNINDDPNVMYGAFARTQGRHRTDVLEGSTTYNFTLFYVDRLTEDKKNVDEVQSVGVQVLQNILLRLLDMGIGVQNAELQPFTQRFSDECAGMYCVVGLTVMNDTNCEQNF